MTGAESRSCAPGAEDQLLQGLPQLLAPVGVNERVDERVADDEDEEEVKVPEEAVAEGAGGAGEDEDEVQEEGAPAHDEDAQQDGEGDGALHAGGLPPVALAEGHDAARVHVRKHKHVQVEHGVEDQRGAEEGDEAHDDGVVRVVDDEEDAGGETGQPHHRDDGDGALSGHDAVVAQRVEDGDVAVGGDGAQEGERGHHGAADHHVNDVVQVPQHPRVHHHQAVVVEQHEDGLHHVADAHQHVGHGQAADEVVHWRVEVAVLEDGQDDQDVLHQADDPQGQEELLRDADLHAGQRAVLSDSDVGVVVLQVVAVRAEIHVERVEVVGGPVVQLHVGHSGGHSVPAGMGKVTAGEEKVAPPKLLNEPSYPEHQVWINTELGCER